MDDVDVRVSARPGRGRCAYCHDDLRAPQRTCEGCGTTYHRDCLGELGGCATPGCAQPGAPTIRIQGGDLRPARPVFGRYQPGQSRACACGERFVVSEASPHRPTCPACTARRNLVTFLAVMGLAVAYVLLVVLSNL